MRRRELLIGAAALAVGSSLHAQAPALRRVAIAASGAPGAQNKAMTAFKSRLAERGWNEGRNIEYVHAYDRGDSSRYEAMIKDLLAQKPAVVMTAFGGMAMVAKKLTRDVPIVFAVSSNPEKIGLVASLARPGGNVTGVSTREVELLGKRIELLREIMPGMRRVAVLTNPDAPGIAKGFVDGYREHAGKVGMQVLVAEARVEGDLRPVFERMVREGAQGLLNVADAPQLAMRVQLAAHAARARLPAVYVIDEFVEAGGLVSYGTDRVDQWRHAAGYVDKILNGAKPADLPVEEPTNFVLAVNVRAAREQGIKIPQSVLLRATKVIE